jgi:hypothetical protein
MDNKKLGMVVLVISIILLGVFIVLIQSLNTSAKALGCFPHTGCQKIETSLSVVHFAFGIFGFLFALGVYLIFFTTGEMAIVNRLEKDTSRKLDEEKFSILLKGLDSFEKNVLTVVREQEGITQNTLRLRVDMSKAKLSQVLSTLENKDLIVRKSSGKTNAVYLKEKY